MLHAGLDLIRHRLDVHLLTEDGALVDARPAPPDADGLRWALVEAALHACQHPAYRERYRRNKQRLGKRGAKVAQVDIARRLAEAMWHMFTRN
jgi:hypothetical protein